MGGDQTTTQEVKMPAWMTDAQKQLVGKGQSMTAPFMQTPAYGQAGFNPDQMMGFDLTRQMAQNAFTTPGLSVPTSAKQATAAQVTGDEIQGMMNPYLKEVLGTTLKSMRGQYDDTNAQIGGRMAAAGAFGGSREAVQRSALDESYGEQVSSTAANLMAQGFDKASALALANAQMRQQAELANTSSTNDYALRAPQVQDALNNSQMARQQTALQQLLGIGGQQQQFAQGNIDLPWTMLQRFGATVPQQYDQTQKTTQPGTSPLQALLGTGLSVLGMGTGGGGTIAGKIFSSDRNDKTDITNLGRDPETGEQLYAYRYKGDPKTYPKTVGPMAQDIEKSQPERVRTIGGHKVVRG